MHDAASDLGRTGQLVAGKFRLDAVIGRGGMGAVWRATHVTLGHHLAIKLVSREYVHSAEALRRFDAEARAAARLQSRHIVQVFDSGTLDDDTPYIAMELLTGENLAQRIARVGSIPLREAVLLLGQCCRALSRAHAAGIIHRDIKPDNLFLARTPDDDADVVKVLDFGIAKMTRDLAASAAVTGTGAMLGTPRFMSPEQVSGSKDIDSRTDLYSLGLVAFTMLTGRQAISGDTLGRVLLQICAEPLPSLTGAAPWLPSGLEPWFQRACARQPDDRHRSAEEFIATLRAACAEALAEAGPATLAAPVTVQALSAFTPGPAIQPSIAARPPDAGRSSAIALPKRTFAGTVGGIATIGATTIGAAVVALVAWHRSGSPPPPKELAASGSPKAVEVVFPSAVSAPPPRSSSDNRAEGPGEASEAAVAPPRHAGPAAVPKHVAPEPTATCFPACRRGYACTPRGQCVSACNPPCVAPQRCTDAGVCALEPRTAEPALGSPSGGGVCFPPCRTGFACDAQSRCVARY
jgi:serine/threonine-protein kinase